MIMLRSLFLALLSYQLTVSQRDSNNFGNFISQRENPFITDTLRTSPPTNNFNSFGTLQQQNRNFLPQNPRQDFSDIRSSDSNSIFNNYEEKECPKGWDSFKSSCYRFVRSPIHTYEDARRNCQAYGNGADLLSIDSIEEHVWMTRRLTAIDPQRREWYVSGRQTAPGNWVNADGSTMINLDQAFLQDQPSISSNVFYNYLTYSYSERRKRWGLLKATGVELLLYICEIPLSQVPYIDKSLEERDFEYGLEIDDSTKVPRGPYFIQEPKDTVYDLSRNGIRSYVALSCLAAGWPAPTYKWFKEEYVNNTLSAGILDPLLNPKYTVSGGMLIIDSPKQVEDRGSYHCIATNPYGSVISETVSLSFGYIGEFIPTRSAEVATQYWGKAIYCDPPNHFPSVLYYWSRRYFPNFVEQDKRVFVSYDGNLYISSVEVSDKDEYICHVQSTVSSSGRTGPLFPLQITSNSNFQTLKFPNNFPKAFPESPSAGDEVRLECVAFGYPVPSYNWTRKGGELPRGSVLSNYNRVLTIPNVKVEDQGEYICLADNNRLTANDSVTLSIQAAPNFTVPLGNRHMDRGDDLIWICEAFGIPDVSYQWYKNGQLLTMETVPREDLGRYQIQDNLLSIRDLIAERDAGMYQCRANNSLTARFSTGQLRVLQIRPNFNKRPLPTEILAAINGNVTIKCEPEAAPRPKFVWRLNGNIIGTGGRRRLLPTGALFINPVSVEDSGLYTCIAQNSLGSEESSGRLTVLLGPTLVQRPPLSLNYSVSSTLSLHCAAEADPSLDIAYIWKLNGRKIEESSSYRISLDSRSGLLQIQNVTLGDKGEYECEVSTWVGNLKALTMVEIFGPPGPVGGVDALVINSTSARLKWTDGAMNGAQAYLYTIQGRTQWNSTWTTLLDSIEPDRTVETSRVESGRKEKFMNVLSPWARYEFRVIAANRYGFGPPSSPSPQVNTPPDKPFIYPRNIRGGGGKTGSLNIVWDPLPEIDQNAPGIYYKVFWRLHSNLSIEPYQSTLVKRGNVGLHVVSIPSIYFYTLYDVKVQAWNDKCVPDNVYGCGPESPPVQIYSAEDMPQVAPSLVIPIPFNSTAINVTWTPVEESREKMRGKLIGYRLRYWRKVENNLYDPEALNYLSRSTAPNALIRGLMPNTYYYVQVMAYNTAGPGPASEPQFERTLKKAPQKPPINVRVSLVNPSTIKITWRYLATTAEEEALSGFIVRIWDADQDMSSANDTYVKFVDRSLEAEVGGLMPAKKYVVRVLAYSPGGFGKMSPPQEIILGDPQALRNASTNFQTNRLLIGAMAFIATLMLLLTEL